MLPHRHCLFQRHAAATSPSPPACLTASPHAAAPSPCPRSRHAPSPHPNTIPISTPPGRRTHADAHTQPPLETADLPTPDSVSSSEQPPSNSAPRRRGRPPKNPKPQTPPASSEPLNSPPSPPPSRTPRVPFGPQPPLSISTSPNTALDAFAAVPPLPADPSQLGLDDILDLPLPDPRMGQRFRLSDSDDVSDTSVTGTIDGREAVRELINGFSEVASSGGGEGDEAGGAGDGDGGDVLEEEDFDADLNYDELIAIGSRVNAARYVERAFERVAMEGEDSVPDLEEELRKEEEAEAVGVREEMQYGQQQQQEEQQQQAERRSGLGMQNETEDAMVSAAVGAVGSARVGRGSAVGGGDTPTALDVYPRDDNLGSVYVDEEFLEGGAAAATPPTEFEEVPEEEEYEYAEGDDEDYEGQEYEDGEEEEYEEGEAGEYEEGDEDPDDENQYAEDEDEAGPDDGVQTRSPEEDASEMQRRVALLVDLMASSGTQLEAKLEAIAPDVDLPMLALLEQRYTTAVALRQEPTTLQHIADLYRTLKYIYERRTSSPAERLLDDVLGILADAASQPDPDRRRADAAARLRNAFTGGMLDVDVFTAAAALAERRQSAVETLAAEQVELVDFKTQTLGLLDHAQKVQVATMESLEAIEAEAERLRVEAPEVLGGREWRVRMEQAGLARGALEDRQRSIEALEEVLLLTRAIERQLLTGRKE